MKKSELYNKVIEYFEAAMPVAETELNYSTPFDLLVAVILSAQCTDKRVNMVTPDLIGRYPTAEEMAQAHPDEIYNYIKSVSYPNNKAKHLVGMAQKLCSDFGGEVPDTLEELVTLPGVGRKTANVILSVVWDRNHRLQPQILLPYHGRGDKRRHPLRCHPLRQLRDKGIHCITHKNGDRRSPFLLYRDFHQNMKDIPK
ncbi:MAG: hypothetical protein IIV04_05650 [Bacteroidaceae bacterium]|nr:hypothetical protein [Bacteroidaceae bacterium]